MSYEVTLGSGSAAAVMGSSAIRRDSVGVGASAHARARVPDTEGDAKVVPLHAVEGVAEAGSNPLRRAIGAVVGVASDTAATVRADAAGSWPLRNHPPSFADLWANRAPAADAYPGESEVLRAVDVVWRHLALVPYGLAFGYLWLLHRAITGVPTVLITLALAGMWINQGGAS